MNEDKLVAWAQVTHTDASIGLPVPADLLKYVSNGLTIY